MLPVATPEKAPPALAPPPSASGFLPGLPVLAGLPEDPRTRVECLSWLFWQCSGVAPYFTQLAAYSAAAVANEKNGRAKTVVTTQVAIRQLRIVCLCFTGAMQFEMRDCVRCGCRGCSRT